MSLHIQGHESVGKNKLRLLICIEAVVNRSNGYTNVFSGIFGCDGDAVPVVAGSMTDMKALVFFAIPRPRIFTVDDDTAVAVVEVKSQVHEFVVGKRLWQSKVIGIAYSPVF